MEVWASRRKNFYILRQVLGCRGGGRTVKILEEGKETCRLHGKSLKEYNATHVGLQKSPPAVGDNMFS
jgi:hypothetical protein